VRSWLPGLSSGTSMEGEEIRDVVEARELRVWVEAL